MNSDYKVGDKVRVDDGENPPFVGIVCGPNPKNTAEYEVNSDGKAWYVHWAYMRSAS